ncbi:hypothetical protein LTR56_018603 [Elasticomyces elasticus]|nr:hypothetical protein LTR56_018603 [Elasticomyces elasticus]KAK3647368.1 hypothetical protein LTR22_013799 [Elasticomyces elasticus]KAK4917648.1 hypothetical protein LTR49_014470 [Elasticomyces elasticus]KAK5752035.1 hypothetical protein LTS12_017885 [Elasticomyces elasticus]
MSDETPAKRQKLDNFESILSKLCEGQASLAQNIANLTKALTSVAGAQTELFQAQQATNNKLNAYIERFDTIHPIRVKSTNAGTRLTETFELLEKILLATSRDTVAAAQGVNKYFRSLIKNSKALRKKLSVPNAGIRLTTNTEILENILINAPMETCKLFFKQTDKAAPLLNPLLTKDSIRTRLPFFLQTAGSGYRLRYGRGGGAERLHAGMPVISTVIVNPGLLQTSGHNLVWKLRRCAVPGWPGEENRLTFSHNDASWPRMYLTNVHPNSIRFDVGHFDGPGADVHNGSTILDDSQLLGIRVRCSAGVNMHNLIRYAQKDLQKHD